jgi:hypothetical protein
MHAHSLASRLLAALLTVTWATLALALGVTPGGGSTRLLLAVGALVPALAATAAIVWPVAAGGRRGRAVAWLGVSALLLAIPYAILTGGPLVAGAAQPIIPSAGVAYAGLLAVLATTVYAAHGWVDARRRGRAGLPGRGHVRATAAGIALTCLVAATGSVALATSDIGLAGVPIGCDDIRIAPHSRVTIDARAEIDATVIATVSVNGERSGRDERWSGAAGGEAVEDREFGYTLIGGRAVLRIDDGQWQTAAEQDASTPGHLDSRVASVLAEPDLPPVEDVGIDLVDGAAARHCRIPIGGPHALRAFLPLGWLLGRAPLDRAAALGVWRGDLDWWIFGDGYLGRATVLIGGHPTDAWVSTGLRGSLRGEMRVVERDVPRTVDEPLP